MINEFKDFYHECQQLKNEVTTLQANLQELRTASNGINQFVTAVSASVEKWQFKNQPRFARIQKIVEHFEH